MANNKTIHLSLSIKSVRETKRKFLFMRNNLPAVKRLFVERSLDYIEERAKEYIRSTVGGSSWYVPTGTLENSWVKNIDTGMLENTCWHAALVEYGTGIIGKGTHPDPASGYQYDVNNHGEEGWFFYDQEGNIHWTRGMVAHRFLYDAINDYYYRGQYKVIFRDVMNELMKGI